MLKSICTPQLFGGLAFLTDRCLSTLLTAHKGLESLLTGLLLARLSRLSLLATGLGLLSESLLTGLLGPELDDVLHKGPLVLESVTLGLHVKDMVQVLVNLLGVSVLDEKAAKHPHAAHPDHLLGETSITGTSPLTDARVTTLALSLKIAPYTVTRVDLLGLADDETILYKLLDALACTPPIRTPYVLRFSTLNTYES